ncbi:unnamed protein product [Closterium sp. NIES-54]
MAHYYNESLMAYGVLLRNSEGLGFESLCVHFGHTSAGGCQRSTGDPRLILGKGYRLVVLGGYRRTDPLLNKLFYPNGLVWLTHDAAARLAIHNHLPLAERAHFGQHKTAKALYNDVVARYSSPSIAALGRLILPYLFPELTAFAAVEYLVLLVALLTHPSLRGVPPPPLPPLTLLLLLLTSLVLRMSGLILLLVESAAAARARVARVVAVSGGGGGGGSGGGEGGGGGGSGGSGGKSGGFGGGGGGTVGVWEAVVAAMGGGGGSGGGRGGAVQRGGSGGGERQQQQCRSKTPTPQHAGSFTLSTGDCYLFVSLDPCIEAAALGASESALPGTAPAAALHTFTLDSGASCCFFCDRTTLTPLRAPVPIRLADPSGGPVLACSSTVLPCSATLLWHHHLGHPSLPRLRGMHSRLLISSLPISLPPLPPSPVAPCLPCVEGRQRASPHSSFPPTTAPLQTLHMDVWGPARVSGHDHERYFVLVVEDYTRYTTVFPLHSKGEVTDVLIPWIRAGRLHLRERFREDLPVLRLHSDRGGEFSSDPLWEFCRREGILCQNSKGLGFESQCKHFEHPSAGGCQRSTGDPRLILGKGYRLVVLGGYGRTDPLLKKPIYPNVMKVVRTSMIHAAASHFLWPFADVTFDESVPFYRLFPYRTVPLPPQSPAPSGVSQVDPLPETVPVKVAVASGATRGVASGGVASRGAASGGAEPASGEPEGAEPGGAESEGAKSGGAELEGAEPGGTEPEGAEPGGTDSEGAESQGAEPRGTASAGGPAGASPRLSP